MTAEHERLDRDRQGVEPWRKWGPYVSDRQWGTVREDYSSGGDAWDYLPFDHARSRAYRWGEDGIAGLPSRRTSVAATAAARSAAGSSAGSITGPGMTQFTRTRGLRAANSTANVRVSVGIAPFDAK